MADLPATDLRQNVLTLAVPNECLPAVAVAMRTLLAAEEYDPDFQGQYLQTTYFDTPDFALRKARLNKDKYLTARYAVESSTDRLTLDSSIRTSTGKLFWTNVLEVKTIAKPYTPPPEVTRWGLHPIKLSKFLWATSPEAR